MDCAVGVPGGQGVAASTGSLLLASHNVMPSWDWELVGLDEKLVTR